jgi:hypothetical protein
MLLAKTLSYYKRRDVQKALVEQAQNKEIAIRFLTFLGRDQIYLCMKRTSWNLQKKGYKLSLF